MTVTQLLALGGVVLLAAMSPGPDFVIVTRNAMLSGRRAGMACAAGIAVGVFTWAVVTALGISGLLAASAVAFTVVKLAGAAYLVLLGIRALLAARRGGYEPPPDSGDRANRGVLAAFRQGLVTNLLNPKVAVFFTALLPQFVPASSTAADHLLLGGVAATVSLLWFVVLSNVVSVLRRFLTTSRVRRTIDAVTGTLLVALGLRIAVQ
ncbi:MAG TPA: LysE family translocator [Actinophytocola sp.]|uniref:LysE family translocator n=1 Tax=Actinophytocola sp. TaxID=1872138 RepID=UPI002F945CDF